MLRAHRTQGLPARSMSGEVVTPHSVLGVDAISGSLGVIEEPVDLPPEATQSRAGSALQEPASEKFEDTSYARVGLILSR